MHLAASPVGRREELAVGPEVVLVQDHDLGRIKQGMLLKPGAPEHEDHRRITLKKHPPVVVFVSQKAKLEALFRKG